MTVSTTSSWTTYAKQWSTPPRVITPDDGQASEPAVGVPSLRLREPYRDRITGRHADPAHERAHDGMAQPSGGGDGRRPWPRPSNGGAPGATWCRRMRELR